MAEIFSWVPSKSFTKESKPTVVTAQFGGGYSQRIKYGINNQVDSWKLSFINQSLTTSSQIISFLESHEGTDYFLFTPPGEITAYKVIASDWSVEYVSHISRTISTTFIRVYDLT